MSHVTALLAEMTNKLLDLAGKLDTTERLYAAQNIQLIQAEALIAQFQIEATANTDLIRRLEAHNLDLLVVVELAKIADAEREVS
jgi:hypothetical protein